METASSSIIFGVGTLSSRPTMGRWVRRCPGLGPDGTLYQATTMGCRRRSDPYSAIASVLEHRLGQSDPVSRCRSRLSRRGLGSRSAMTASATGATTVNSSPSPRRRTGSASFQAGPPMGSRWWTIRRTTTRWAGVLRPGARPINTGLVYTYSAWEDSTPTTARHTGLPGGSALHGARQAGGAVDGEWAQQWSLSLPARSRRLDAALFGLWERLRVATDGTVYVGNSMDCDRSSARPPA